MTSKYAAVRIVGTTDKYKISIDSAMAIIRLDGVNIKAADGPALTVNPNSFVMLLLERNNELTGGNGYPAIQKDGSSSFSTMGPGKLITIDG